MDAFHYYNIFDTKGLEYIAVILFFLILIPFWFILNRPLKLMTQVKKSLGIISASEINIPQGLFYSKNHTWAHLESSGTAKVGLDDLLLHITGAVKFSQLKKSGDKINKGDLIAEIDHNNKSLKVFSPISGEILATNSVLTKNPELVNNDPYQNGWMYRIKPSGWLSETNTYYLAEEATNWMFKELVRFKDFLAASMGKYSQNTANVILQDGGEILKHPLSELPDEVWQDFQRNFLNTTMS